MRFDKRWLALVVLAIAVAAYFYFDIGSYLSIGALKSRQSDFEAWRSAQPFTAAAIFFGIYVAATALSVPGAVILTLAAGALFGLWWGTLIVSFAASIGATLAFLISRYLLRDWVRSKFGERLETLDKGIAKDGPFYLFTLRLVPVFPFFLVNLAMGVTGIKTLVFYAVSQIGMLAGTFVYVNAGTQLGQIESLSGIVSPGVIGSFVVLGIFPLLAKKAVDWYKARQVYGDWKKPDSFDCNLIVIGAGSAGLVAAYIAAAVKAKVTLVERAEMGGDCLNTGCVPSKALIRSARLLSNIRRAKEFGLGDAHADFDFAEVMERVQRVVTEVEPHDSVERYSSLGVDVVKGEAKIITPWTVEIAHEDGRIQHLTSRAIVIATGAQAAVPPIPGLQDVGYLTSDTLWSLRELPRRLVVLGGGPIGSEMTQAFARLGAEVTQVEMAPRIMAREDVEVSELVKKRFEAEGIRVLVSHKALRFETDGGDKILVAEHQGAEVRIAFDAVLVAVGRAARLTGFGLETLGIETGKTVATNDFLQTKFPNIYAAGDVAGPYQFTHTASHQAWYAAVNALFDPFKKFRVDYRVIPWATFVDPEVAHLGLNELEAKEKNVEYELTVYKMDESDRAIADGETEGFVKVLTVPGKDTILGVTIVGEHSAEVLAEFVLAMKYKLGLNKILGTIHTYPTLSEVNKGTAGKWKQAHAPEGLLRWAGRFHAWRRG